MPYSRQSSEFHFNLNIPDQAEYLSGVRRAIEWMFHVEIEQSIFPGRDVNQADRGLDGMNTYESYATGHWGAFMARAGIPFRYMGLPSAAIPSFIVQIAPGQNGFFFTGDLNASRVSTRTLGDIGAYATEHLTPCFLTLGGTMTRVIIGIIPAFMHVFERLHENGREPIMPPGARPFHIVMGYDWTVCPNCITPVLSLPHPDATGVYVAQPRQNTLRRTIPHGPCPACNMPQTMTMCAQFDMAATQATDLTRHLQQRQMGYGLDGLYRW